MADLTFTESYDEVYQLETSDPVLGGAGGVANEQSQKLGNRTEWLKARIVPTGTVCQWPTATPPTGWLEANGQSVLNASYPDLFDLVGISGGGIFTIASGLNDLTPVYFNDYAEINFIPDGASLPVTTPQIAINTSYWIRNVGPTIFAVYPTLLDAQNYTNIIQFQPVTGANTVIAEYADRFTVPDYSSIPTIPGGIHIIKT